MSESDLRSAEISGESAELPREVRDTFLQRLRSALSGDDEAAAGVAAVLDSEVPKAIEAHQRRGLFARTLGAAGAAWATISSWRRLASFARSSVESLVLETLKLAFQTILTVPIGVKFSGDTARLAAFQMKAILYYLNGRPIPQADLAANAEYAKEAKRIAGYLTKLGIRGGLFALPGIGAVAAATLGKWLESKVQASFGESDPAIVSELRALIPKAKHPGA